MNGLEQKKKAYVFPGQGSQNVGMGEELFEKYSGLVNEADKILGYSIKELCLEDENKQLDLTCYTQTALYVVECLSYLEKIKEDGKPDYVAGHSLGEYSALFAGGAFDFGTGLRLVKKRGELMYQAKGGSMAAVIGLEPEQIRSILKQNHLDRIDVANYNSPSQTVLSGIKEDIEDAKSIFEEKNARYIILKVSGAFHSRYMKEAQDSYRTYINNFEFNALEIPVISNVSARPYKNDEIKANLVEQMTNSVQWLDTIRYFMGINVNNIVQVGPGLALTNLQKAILRDATPLYVEDEIVEKKEEHQVKKLQQEAKKITADDIGSVEFKKKYGLKYAYVSGSMYHGIASKEMVVKMAKAKMLGFLGTGGMKREEIEENIIYIKRALKNNEVFGANLLANLVNPYKEEETVDLYLQYGVDVVEASAYMSVSPAIARYRIKGLYRNADGIVCGKNRIIAKISRPEVAEAFLSPIPEKILQKLQNENKIMEAEADMAREISVADDLCVEADSGGHTDGGVLFALLPAIQNLRNILVKQYSYKKNIQVGAAGGLGTPEAIAAAIIMGADFITTGSINECTVEAGTSDIVKDLLQKINVQDTEYAPAGDMFEMGAKVQVMKKGVFFPARANKLYDLYRQNDSIEEIEELTKKQIEERYFHKTFDEVFEECKKHYKVEEIQRVEKSPKQKMAMIFRWYFGYTTRLAIDGKIEYKVDFQIHCGPSLGAFNQWVLGTELEDWNNRHVDQIALKLMEETVDILNKRYKEMMG